MIKNLVPLILLFLLIAHPGFSQNMLTQKVHYEVNRIYPPFSITKEKLIESGTLMDLNEHYPSSWIREYISVEILASYKGKTRKAMGKSDTLSREQKDIMNMADVGTGISVIVQYIPENTLTHNDIQEISFSLTIEPETEAAYPGGQQQLNQYLKENVIDKIPDGIFTGYKLAAVKFTIDEVGQVTDTHIFWPSDDEITDDFMLEAVCHLPNWKPAEYADGTKIKQEFVFTVGSMENCVVNLLNIRRY